MQKVDICANATDYNRFKSTNQLWNKERFNSPWLWGFVSKLANPKFKTKEEWMESYYKSGEERLKLISKLKPEEQAALKEFRFDTPESLPYNLRGLNYNYGRTYEELVEYATMMYPKVPKSIALDEWIQMVIYRLLGETWNGIVREKNTVSVLTKMFSKGKLCFRTTTGLDDYNLGIDYEFYDGDKLLAGIQIKPISFTYKTAYTQTAQGALDKKFIKYFKQKGVPAFYVFSEYDGTIINSDVIDKLLMMCEPTYHLPS